jgi:hypothetical protein
VSSIAIAQALSIASNHTNIMSMSSSNSIVYRQAIGNLSNGVWLGLTLAIVSIMPVSTSSYNPQIVRVSSSISIVDGKPMSNLANGVGVTVTLDRGNSKEDLKERILII